jgi:N-methylhydantoinase B/oxoprolinase/acetone carboxylase alpha subunit
VLLPMAGLRATATNRRGRTVFVRAARSVRLAAEKKMRRSPPPGARVAVDSAGGGGAGDPSDRDPKYIAEDPRLGYITPEAKRRDYRMVLPWPP